MSINSLFITFEGGEASGKSTQVRLLERFLKRKGYEVSRLVEPGSTSLGRQLRRMLKYSPETIVPEAEAFLFMAARSQLVRSNITPVLQRSGIVICDRYVDSTIAYQGYGRGLDLDFLRRCNLIATDGLIPSLTILLDLSPILASGRRPPVEEDRFDKEFDDDCEGLGDPGFHDRVRQGYLTMAKDDPKRWLVIDADQPSRTIAARIRIRVTSMLSDGFR